ncbi:hypothetical protein Nmel_003703 [Mimus melanotis]
MIQVGHAYLQDHLPSYKKAFCWIQTFCSQIIAEQILIFPLPGAICKSLARRVKPSTRCTSHKCITIQWKG